MVVILYSPVAQLIVQTTVNRWVVGLSPTGRANGLEALMVMQSALNRQNGVRYLTGPPKGLTFNSKYVIIQCACSSARIRARGYEPRPVGGSNPPRHTKKRTDKIKRIIRLENRIHICKGICIYNGK